VRRTVLALLLGALLLGPELALAQTVNRTIGQVSISAELKDAHPGGLMPVTLRWARGGFVPAWAILYGKRFAFLSARRGPRVLIPVPLTATPGRTTLGIEVAGRTGRQRVAVDVTVAPKSYGTRSVEVAETKRGLLAAPARIRDGRELLVLLRTITPAQLWTTFQPPVDAAPLPSFGLAQTWEGCGPVESLMDSTWGEQHRGQDYEVPYGTPVLAPAPGTVLFSGNLTLSGQTVVLDHGQGVVSVFYHLSRMDVVPGQEVGARAPLGLVGETGLAPSAHLHWGTYVNGTAVDPEIVLRLAD
jgi:murein DD-endopeptidase MepM/ murein hydrolase activator NlpD